MTTDRPRSSLETTARIEPTRLENPPEAIADLAGELAGAAAALGRTVHSKTRTHLADLVRIVNAHYSNLIEGHDGRPLDIERALAGEFDKADGLRNLQMEVVAHVRVQADIDRMAVEETLPEPASREFVRWVHKEFYRDAPEPMLRVRGAGRDFVMNPGEWRSHPEHDVAVGRHVPPSSDRVDAFMTYSGERYDLGALSKTGRIIAMATAHHRFNYIHPFPDGNGRVSRLVTHAMAWRADVAAHGLWSISRGLARGLDSNGEYQQMMDFADTPRQSDIDGRGNLSQKALIDFVAWFLRVAVGQVVFMSALFDRATLANRLRQFVAASESLTPESARLTEEALVRGDIEREEAGRITGLPERSAARVLDALTSEGLLGSETLNGAVSLRFPVDSLESLFPGLCPEA